MGDNRTAVLTSLALFAACGGRVRTDSGTNGSTTGMQSTTGIQTSTGMETTTGVQTSTGMETTTGMAFTDSGFGTGTSTGFGGGAGVSACGSVTCEPGFVCCSASCSLCAQAGQACPECADAGAGGVGGSEGVQGDVAEHKSNFGFAWKDSWFISGCAVQAGPNCINVPICPNQMATDFEEKGAVVNETFPLGGVQGTTYAVTFKFNGIVEAKFYQGGQWGLPDTDVATPGGPPPDVNEAGIANDTFYIGGSAVASNYAVMRMRVLDATKKEVGRYYMNAYPPTSGAESHRTFAISYSHTIDVPGKGFVEYHLADSNCSMIDNCGPPLSTFDGCFAARSIPNEPNVILPAMYTDVASPIQPHMVPLGLLNPITGAKQPWHSQISHFTVTKFVAK